MQIGMIGLGRMGANLVQRLLRGGHSCVVYDADPAAVERVGTEGAIPARSLGALASALDPPRVVWTMVPAAAVDSVLDDLVPKLDRGDVVIDGGNSHFSDDQRRAAALARSGVHHLDVGTSGGVYGLERGFCLMIGGEDEPVRRLGPLFATLAPGVDAAPRTAGRAAAASTAEHGYLHCGPSGAGHFVKMVHNGIEYGLMAALAEGLGILARAGEGREQRPPSPEAAPLEHPERYRFDFDLAEIAELWRRGSVVSSWLVDLLAESLARDPRLEHLAGRVADSGEGRWAVQAAVEEGVPIPVLSAALYQRFSSRGAADLPDRVLSALREAFGGHSEATVRAGERR